LAVSFILVISAYSAIFRTVPLCAKKDAESGATGAGSAVKMIAEYLENALRFERLAAEESNARLKADFENQAKAYRKLAAERAGKLGLQPPLQIKNSLSGYS